MSRLAVTAVYQGYTDDNAVVGWDPGLATFFLQAFRNQGETGLWLGGDFAEFPTANALAQRCASLGVSLFHVWGRTVEDQRASEELNAIFNSIFSGQRPNEYSEKALQ